MESVDHVNIVVEDLDGMLEFYTGVLGLRISRTVSIRGDWVDRVTGLEGVEGDVVYLEALEGTARVELIRYRSPASRRPEALGVPNVPGIRHIAFRVGDVGAMADALRAAGVELLSDVEMVPAEQVTYEGGARKRIVYFRDPEGNLLEVCSYS